MQFMMFISLKIVDQVSPLMNSLQESIQQNLKLHIHSHIVFTISNEFLDVKIPTKYISLYKSFIIILPEFISTTKRAINYLCYV